MRRIRLRAYSTIGFGKRTSLRTDRSIALYRLNRLIHEMKVHINETHSGGVIFDEKSYKGVHVTYSIENGETGHYLVDREFSTYGAAEAYLAEHFSGCERWTSPPPSPDERSELTRVLEYMEKGGADRWKYPTPTRRGIWARLSYQLHQRTLEPEIVSRVEAVLTDNPYDDTPPTTVA